MPAREPIASADIAVVGAGIVGLGVALEALDRGLSVVVVEREQRAVGASVRNFGHVIVSGVAPGAPLSWALETRRRWLRLANEGALPVVQEGTVVVTRHPDEVAVLEQYAAAEPARGVRMITASELDALAPVPTDEVIGGLHATLDVRVNPREAAARIAGHLERRGVRFVWGTAVSGADPPVLETTGGGVRADHVVVCPGPDLMTLFPAVFAEREGMNRVRLQMLRVDAPAGRRYGPALITGLSLLRYPAFAAQPGAGPLRDRLVRERPELIDAGVHLIVTQLPDGDLIVGDSHDYGFTLSPFGAEAIDELVLGEARRLLGASRLHVRERWQGVYPIAADEPLLLAAPAEGVRVVSIVSGIGMTIGLGIAPIVLDDLLPGS